MFGRWAGVVRQEIRVRSKKDLPPLLNCHPAERGLLDIVSVLLRAGAKHNAVDKAGVLPINLASKHKRHDVVDLLFSARASKNRKQKK